MAKAGDLTLAGGSITNGDTGIQVDGPTVTATLTGTEIRGLDGNGIEVLSTAGVILDQVHVTATRAAGIKHVAGTLGISGSEIDANIDDGLKVLGGAFELAGTKIHGNGAYGVSVAGAEASIHGCELYGNGNKNAGGGLGFVGAGASLSQFFGNKLHGNFRAQLYFGAEPASGTWKISSISCQSPSVPNALACYATDAFGVLAASGVSVAANNVSWMHAPPTVADKDFSGSVTATSYCSVAACP
ncbi:MAG: right-handed parallel beta-helix repeat-containing protein [Myxococcales bacterium]